MDELTRVTELQASSGSNMVLAGVVILGVIGFLGLALAYMRARLFDEKEERRAEREERRKMFEKLLGDGNGSRGAIQNIEDQIKSMCQEATLRRKDCSERMSRHEEFINTIVDALTNLPCMRGVHCVVGGGLMDAKTTKVDEGGSSEVV